MDRKSFFKTLFAGIAGLLVAPQVIKAKIVKRTEWVNPGLFIADEPIPQRTAIIGGRRSGKTSEAARIAVQEFLKGKRVLYLTPSTDGVEKFWRETKRILADKFSSGEVADAEVYRGSGLYWRTITNIPPHPVNCIRAKIARNANSVCGEWFNVVILDNYDMMDASIWNDHCAPMLIDQNGDAILILNDSPSGKEIFAELMKSEHWICRWLYESKPNPYITAI